MKHSISFDLLFYVLNKSIDTFMNFPFDDSATDEWKEGFLAGIRQAIETFKEIEGNQ